MSERKNETKYVFLALLAVSMLASSGIFVRYSLLPPVNTGFWRCVFALPFLFFLARKDLHTLKKKDILIIFIAGIFFALDLLLYNLAMVRTSMANTNLLSNLTAFVIVPASYFIFKEKIPKGFFLGAVIAVIGVIVLVLGKTTPCETNYIGDLMAFGASFFYGIYILISYRSRDRFSSSAILFVVSIGMIFTLGVGACLIEGGIEVPNSMQKLLPILGLTLTVQIGGHNLLSHCQGHLRVNLSSVIQLCQPAIAAIYSFFFFSEALSLMEISGIVLVVCGVYLVKRKYSSEE